MNKQNTPAFLLHTATAFLLFFSMSYAQAVTINFDDLVRNEDPSFYAHPLTTEYASEGLLINDGFLMEWYEDDDPISAPNHLLGGNLLRLTFTGNQPNFVSLYVTSPRADRVYLRAFTNSGAEHLQNTSGWAGPFDNSPYVPNEYLEFNLSEAISEIWVSSYYSRNTSAIIDDLTFYSTTDVPEPPLLTLLALGLFAVALQRRLRAP